MTQNQIIALLVLIACIVAMIGICIVAYLQMFPDKWYQYEICYYTDFEDWPSYDGYDYIWTNRKIKGEFELSRIAAVIKSQTKEDHVTIQSYRFMRTKRCRKGHRP